MKKFQNPLSAMFSDEKILQKIEKRMESKTFAERYLPLKRIAVPLSHLFALISALGLIMLVYFGACLMFEEWYFPVIIAVVFAYFFEKIKRMSSSEFYEYFWFKKRIHFGWLSLTIAIFVISLLSSPFGLKKSTTKLSAPADIIAYNQQSKDYEQKVKDLKAQNKKLSESTNSNGEIFWPAQKSIQANTKTITEYEKEIRRLNQITESDNHLLTEAHKAEVFITGKITMWVTIIFEFLFEICICFIYYYYARVSWERKNLPNYPTRSKYQNVLDFENMMEQKIMTMEQNFAKIINKKNKQLSEQAMRNKAEQGKLMEQLSNLKINGHQLNEINGNSPN